jgi:outer membrane protein assembly factor BamB
VSRLMRKVEPTWMPLLALGSLVFAFATLSQLPRHLTARVVRLVRPAALPSAAAVAVRSIGASGDLARTRVPERTTMTHGDARRTHRAHGVGPTHANLRWKLDLGSAVVTQPVPTADLRSAYVGTLLGDLVRLSLEGAVEWRRATGGRVYGAPAVGADGSVFVGTDDHALLAFSSTGELRFRLRTDDEVDVPLLVRKDASVVFASGREVLAVSSRGNVMFRFAADRKVFTAVAEDDAGTLFFGSQDKRVYALTQNGILKWKTALGADVDGAPVVDDDGSVFVGTDAGELVHLSANGEVLMRTALGGFVRGSLSIARDGSLLTGVYGPASGLRRVSQSGQVLASFFIPSTHEKEFGVHGGALEDDAQSVFFGAQDNRLYAFNRDGSFRFAFETGGDLDAPVTLLSDGRLLVASEDGNVYCVAD